MVLWNFYCVLLQNHNYLVACQEVAVESKHIDCGHPIKWVSKAFTLALEISAIKKKKETSINDGEGKGGPKILFVECLLSAKLWFTL